MPRIAKEPKALKKDIMEATIKVFNEKGLKFTMDDIAKECHISKKTLYLIFDDKDQLFFTMVDYIFDAIKESEDAVLSDESLSTIEKLRKIIGVMPEGYRDIDFRQLYILRDKYPSTYAQVEERLETGWETTIQLIEQGIKEGVIRPVPVPLIKMMIEASLEQFFQRDILIKNKISYNTALAAVVDIIVDGIAVR
ncbi:MAG: TetR/AcrR family transcriptional regulator [Lachnospiraceae bacterium]|nr:TetR/AcrR family transcriptional regulator [Lachnospiraceae bacterium]